MPRDFAMSRASHDIWTGNVANGIGSTLSRISFDLFLCLGCHIASGKQRRNRAHRLSSYSSIVFFVSSQLTSERYYSYRNSPRVSSAAGAFIHFKPLRLRCAFCMQHQSYSDFNGVQIRSAHQSVRHALLISTVYGVRSSQIPTDLFFTLVLFLSGTKGPLSQRHTRKAVIPTPPNVRL